MRHVGCFSAELCLGGDGIPGAEPGAKRGWDHPGVRPGTVSPGLHGSLIPRLHVPKYRYSLLQPLVPSDFVGCQGWMRIHSSVPIGEDGWGGAEMRDPSLSLHPRPLSAEQRDG